MSTDNPFSDFDQSATPRVDNGKPLLTVFLVLGTLLLLFCGGMGTLLVYVYRQTNPAPIVELPKRTNGFRKCLDEFNEGLAELAASSAKTSTTPDPAAAQIEKFVTSSLQLLENDEPIPFNNSMFAEAINKSELMHGQMSVFQRVQLMNWLESSAPLPWSGGGCKIVQIRQPKENLAIVDFLLHMGDSESESFRWHLVKVASGWELFDWRALDFGQSMSDEYAAYVIDHTSAADGYDQVIQLIGEADLTDDPSEAKKLLRKAEDTPLLESDRLAALMAISYGWSRQEEVDEALRVAQLIEDPDGLLGAWPMIAYCYRVKGDYDAAMNAIDHLAALSPNHPNVHLVRSEIWADMNQHEKSVDAATRALAILPEDEITWRSTITLANPDRIIDLLPQWIPLLVNGKQNDVWAQLLQKAEQSSDLLEVIELLDADKRMPSGVAAIARGHKADRESKPNEAANWYLEAEKACEQESLSQYARAQRLKVRLEAEQFDKLFDEAANISHTLETLTTLAYDYDLSCDRQKLLAALEAASIDDPWATCLQAALCSSLYNHEQAIAHFKKLEEWLKQQTQLDDPWLGEAVLRDFADALLQQQRPLDVIRQWPTNAELHRAVGDYLVETNDPELSRSFLAATADTQADSVQCQRDRILASAALANGDFEAANKHHLAALHGMSQLEEDTSSEVISQHAGQIVFKSSRPVIPAYEEADQSTEFINEAAIFASEQRDEVAFERWIGLAKQDPENQASAFRRELGFLRQLGDNDKAISLCESFLGDLPEGNAETPYSISLAAEFFLQVGRYGDALKWLNEKDSTIPHEAAVALAKGDSVALLSLLDEVDDVAARRWLNWRDDTLRRHAHEPWVATLQEKYPQSFDNGYTEHTAELLFPTDTQFDLSELKEILTLIVGSPLDAAHIPCLDATSQAWRFTAKTTQQRIVVTTKKVALQQPAVRSDLRRYFAKPVLRVSLEWMDERPKNRERIFKFAAELAKRDAFAFCLHNFGASNLIWTGPNLSKKINWQSRVPYAKDVTVGYFVGTDSDNHYKTQSFAQWSEQLRTSNKGFPANVILSTSFCAEVIPAKIIRVDNRNEDLIVRLTQSSVIDPLVVAGRAYTCSRYDLMLPKTESRK